MRRHHIGMGTDQTYETCGNFPARRFVRRRRVPGDTTAVERQMHAGRTDYLLFQERPRQLTRSLRLNTFHRVNDNSRLCSLDFRNASASAGVISPPKEPSETAYEIMNLLPFRVLNSIMIICIWKKSSIPRRQKTKNMTVPADLHDISHFRSRYFTLQADSQNGEK